MAHMDAPDPDSASARQAEGHQAVIVEIARIQERGRTIRTAVIASAIVLGLLILTVGVVKAIEVLEKPPWLVLVAIIVAALLGPTGVITVLLKSRRKAIEKDHRIRAKLEQEIDHTRTSSLDFRKSRP